MKRFIILPDYKIDKNLLCARAKFSPPRRRNPVNIPLWHLNNDEWTLDSKNRIVLTYQGRFIRFQNIRLQHITEIYEGDINAMLEWINEKEVDWSIQVNGKTRRLPGSKKIDTFYPAFSFNDLNTAIEFKLTFG